MTPQRLIVFDVEGVLLPKAHFLLLEVVRRMGFWALVKATFFGALYEIGLLSPKDLLKRLYKPLTGAPLGQLIAISQHLPLMPGTETVISELKKTGFKIALISSGIPTIVLKQMADRLEVDYISGVEVGVTKERLTGEIWGDVIEPEGKAAALRKLLDQLGSTYVVTVADDRNNLSLFKLSDLKIGFNSDFILSYRSDHVVKGDLLDVLPLVQGETRQDGGTLSKSNVLREAIHIGGFTTALVSAYLLDHYVVALCILLVTVVYAASELSRILGRPVPIISAITLKMARKAEAHEYVTSPILYALSILMMLILFPGPISYTSIAILTLGDGCASICGRRFGRTKIPFNKNKSLEGSLCGFVSAFLGALLFVSPLYALVASAVGMITELFPLPANDNLTVPFSSGLALMALG